MEKNYAGISCAVTWYDSPDGYEDVFISFGEEEFDTNADLNTFYYFNDKEVAGLFKAIQESRDKYSVGDEWFIDLTEGYDLCG